MLLDILQQILNNYEVQRSNRKVSEMEKQLQELKDAEASGTSNSGRKKKASPQVQVC